MNKVGVSKVGLVQCRDQVKGFCLIPLGTREMGDGKSGHSGSFALESSPSLQGLLYSKQLLCASELCLLSLGLQYAKTVPLGVLEGPS